MPSYNTSSTEQKRATAIKNGDPVGFFESLARLLKIGSYYPEGHVVFERALRYFQSHLRAFKSVANGVELEINRTGCIVGGLDVGKLSSVGEEMRRLIFNAGLHRIIFHHQVTSRDMQLFFIRLSEWKIKAGGAQNFVYFSGDNFPQTIEVFQQEFVASQGEKEKGETSSAAVNSNNIYDGIGDICRNLIKNGHSREDVILCRDFLVKASMKQAVEEDEPSSEKDDDLEWGDLVEMISGLISKTNRSEKNSTFSDGTELNVITNIFESFKAEKEGTAREAINILLRHFNNEAEAEEQNTPILVKKVISPKEDKSELRSSLSQKIEDRDTEDRQREIAAGKRAVLEAHQKQRDDLFQFVSRKRIPVELLQKLSASDFSEELSILFQLYLDASERESLVTLAWRIKSLFTQRPTGREWNVTMAGLNAVICKQGFGSFFALCRGVLESLHADGGSLGQRFVIDLVRRVDNEHRAMLWPFLVNEMVVAGAGERTRFVLLARYAARMPDKSMFSFLPYLESLDGFGKMEGKKYCTFFLPDVVEAFPLYSFLLETSLNQETANQVLDGLQSNPPDHFMSAVSHLLRPDNAEHLQLLKQYLLSRPKGDLPAIVQDRGAQLLVNFLRASEGRDVDEEMLLELIAASKGIASDVIQGMLKRITSEKKMGVVYLWSTRCRKVAGDLLATTKEL